MDDGDSQQLKFSFASDLSTQANRENFTKVRIDQSGNLYATSFTSFTGSHLCVTKQQYDNRFDDNLKNNLQNYENKLGYIVKSTGIIFNREDNNDITNNMIPNINESLPVIELTDKEKDTTCYGIISGKNTSKKSLDRLIINSVGEGAIMVSNINGNITNGSYITSSKIPGIGMKQDDFILHNYTVAKSVEDEDFADSYQEIEYNGNIYRIKLVGCTYHCG